MGEQAEMATFLLTDIEGSTQLWENHRDIMPRLLELHDSIIAEALAQHGGQVIKHTGDGIFAVFHGGKPLHCALAIRRQLAGCDWTPTGELRIRMALHSGEAERRGDDYFGPSINRTARVMAVGWGGQTLVTPRPGITLTCLKAPGWTIWACIA